MLQTARHFRSKTFCDKIKTESAKKIEKVTRTSNPNETNQSSNNIQRKTWFSSAKTFSDNQTPLLFDTILNKPQKTKGIPEYTIMKYDDNCIEESKIEKIIAISLLLCIQKRN